MRLLALAAALCCASGGALPQTEPRKPAAARTVDDTRSRQLLREAETALAKGNYAEAESASLRLLQENIRTFGPDHQNVATALSLLGAAHLKQGKFNEAEGDFRRMLTIYERRLGPEHEYTAAALNSLALALEQLGDYKGAETLLRRSLAISEKKLGKNHPDTATTLSNLSRVLDSQGKFAGSDAGAGSDAAQLAARADAAMRRGQYEEAETLHHQVLAIHEKTLGPMHPTTANSMSNLGRVLDLQGKYAEAEKMYRQSLAVREKVLGRDHPDVATNLNNLAKVMQDLGKDQSISVSEARARARTGAAVGALTEIETMYRRALAIQDRSLGREHPSTALTLNNLGGLFAVRGDFAQAEQMQRAALGTMEKVFGEQHPDTAAVLTSLALALDNQGKIVEAEATYRRAIEISRKSGNPRSLLINAANLGYALAKRGRYREALPYYKEAVETVDFLYSQTRGYSEETRASFLQQFSAIYRETIRVLLQLHRTQPSAGYDREALAIASRNQSRIFTELMRQADVSRFSGEPAFVRLRERRDQLQERLAQLRNGRATVPVTLPNAEQRVAEFDAQITQSSIDLIAAEDQLWREYPRFMELANPRPVTVEDLQQRLLRPGEALLSYVLLPQETVIFAVTREQFRMTVTAVKRAAIAERVHAMRRAIEKVAIGESVLFLREVDPEALHSLYRDLLAPVAGMIAGREKLLIVADGPLQTIPFELLVATYGNAERAAFERTKEAADGSAQRPYLGEYAGLDYAGRRFRFAYLPSLSALTSQRLYPKRSSVAKLDLVAFADPLFAPDAQHAMAGATIKALAQLNVGFGRSPGGGAPLIPRLAETAEEASEIARVLGGRTQLYVGEAAQEKVAKSGDLRLARFVLFATHGFLGGEYLGSDLPLEDGEVRRVARAQAQPALALTLVGDLKGEDGLLTMKEVIEDLELNAELVALSACNTAGESAQANNGEGFAGLTRAFMYAGAKGLLVSHWSVDSLSTQALMTSTFRNIKAGMGALPAVSDAQKQLLQGGYSRDGHYFSRAHPFFWAAFVYVGD
jgi:CHAT domain-containing protein/Flp pilus assembly protein TadD